MVCYCCGSKAYETMLWEPGTKVVCCGSKAKNEDVVAVGASSRRCCSGVVAVGIRHCIAETHRRSYSCRFLIIPEGPKQSNHK
jgi:hypothetical protein